MSEWAKPFDFPNSGATDDNARKPLGGPVTVHDSIVEALKSVTAEDSVRVNQIVAHPDMISFINGKDIKFLTGMRDFIETGILNEHMTSFSDGMHKVYTSMVAKPIKTKKPVWHGGKPVQIGGAWYSFVATVLTAIKVMQCVGISVILAGGAGAEHDAAQCSKYIARDQANLLDIENVKAQTIAMKKSNQKEKSNLKKLEDNDRLTSEKAKQHSKDLNRASDELNAAKHERADIIKRDRKREAKEKQT